jgi:hypothetical protein
MRFDANVRYLNRGASGADLFSGIESPGDGVVLVSTTAAWQNISPAGQRSYLNSLFNLWTVAQEGSGPTVVRILDPRGRVLLEKIGSRLEEGACTPTLWPGLGGELSGQHPSLVLAMGRHPAPVPGMTAVRRNPAVRAATSAFPRFRQLHPQQQTRRSGGLEGST